MINAPSRSVLAQIRGRLAAAAGLQAVASLAGVAALVSVAEAGVALTGSTPATAWTWAWVGAGSALAALALATAATVISHLADNGLQLRLRRAMADRLGRVPLGWFSARNSGQVKKTLHDDIATMHHLVAHTALDVTSLVVTPLACLAYLAVVDWRMAVVVALPAVAGLLLFRRAMAGAGPRMGEYARSMAEVNAASVEFVEGIAVVKSFGGARSAHGRFTAAADRFHEFFTDWVRSTRAVSTASFLVVSPVPVLLVTAVAGTGLVAGGLVEQWAMIPFLVLAPAVAAPVNSVGTRIQALRTGIAAATGVATLLDEPEMTRPSAPRVPEGSRVELRGVGFAYRPGEPVLTDVDLDLAPGTVTALVGPSGAGKSTLAKLVPRFHDVTDGAVRIGGVDVREIDPATLYRTVGFVFQDVTLLRATLADNIRLARPDADLSDVVAAATAACVHERITALPRGYDSEIGVDAELSGGEAQRVSIARALLADPPVLVLDEATAYADPESEAQIQTALSALVAGRTLLVVAHRLDSVRAADQIAVLDGGRVVELGAHDELLAADGRYAALWRAQNTMEVRS